MTLGKEAHEMGNVNGMKQGKNQQKCQSLGPDQQQRKTIQMAGSMEKTVQIPMERMDQMVETTGKKVEMAMEKEV
jgi:hypothetical protein